jgi:hypothetical protein
MPCCCADPPLVNQTSSAYAAHCVSAGLLLALLLLVLLLQLTCSCPSHAAVQERHHQLFEVLGGCQDVVDVTSTAGQFRGFVHQDQPHGASLFLIWLLTVPLG